MLSKGEILEIIQKEANRNGGIPLGLKRFQDKTGIRPYEWNRYWPRFGDAQKEAGFKANTLNPAYDDIYLFEKFILLAREIGKLPVRGELRVKKTSEPDFPDPKTFYRLGTKQKMLSKLLKYSEQKGYMDIVDLCKAELIDTKESIEIEDDNIVEKIGSVYLAKSGKFYKIGRTNSMGRRHHEITILLPEDFMLIHEIKTDDPSGIEAYWHRRFESKRKNGEWFDLNTNDVKAFKCWKKIV